MPTASFSKFNSFVEDLAEKKIDLSGSGLYLLLTNTAPVAGDTVVDTTTSPCTVKSTSNAVEIAAGSGYTKGGNNAAVSSSAQSSGTYTLSCTQVVFTASGTWPTFRYVVLYDNASGTTSTRSVIGWWDYGVGGVTLNNGETFTVKFSNASPGAVLTLA